MNREDTEAAGMIVGAVVELEAEATSLTVAAPSPSSVAQGRSARRQRPGRGSDERCVWRSAR